LKWEVLIYIAHFTMSQCALQSVEDFNGLAYYGGQHAYGHSLFHSYSLSINYFYIIVLVHIYASYVYCMQCIGKYWLETKYFARQASDRIAPKLVAPDKDKYFVFLGPSHYIGHWSHGLDWNFSDTNILEYYLYKNQC
jgi:hypothetical protein